VAAAPAPAPAETSSAELVEKIHHALLIPGSEVLYSAESAPPTIAAAWTAVQQSAAKVSQGAEQLAAGRKGADTWNTLARQVAEAARASGAASAASDTDQLRLANEQLAAACTGCHQAFAQPKP
jgi:cytochrome c556